MKIGIVTQPLSRNYGGILQNYALQQTLKKLGHEPYTFDLKAPGTRHGWIKRTTKALFKRLIGRKVAIYESPLKIAITEIPLRRFVKRNISLTTPRTFIPVAQRIEEYGFEAIISGSDQVWRPYYNLSIEDMYLRFALPYNVKRIAYAASFGTGEWEYNEKQEAACKTLIEKFDAISVREDSAVELCKEHFGIEAKHLLDPTLLLTSDEYNTLIDNIETSSEEYLFAYILDKSSEKIEYIRKIAAQKKLKPIVVGVSENVKFSDSVEKWLALFRDCKYVVTDSFHGCVFSIIYNKEFHAIANITRGVDRMTSLLGALKLDNRLMDEAALCNDPLPKIDWTTINHNLEQLRNESIGFLRTNLS